ncbi:hypothetical protein CVT24_007849 [Panaeolus cyanescens]|uniref:Uncharacterized protein n=1 Tax=Panaeolus cyanescens TaxID=181874 RepID=A0A409VZC8_9AGAR|nr:hypothetical protein CVT24_007849 [Panaeolus cyanescens]
MRIELTFFCAFSSRGVRRQYPNPMWNHKTNQPRTPALNTMLPIDHPDYSPPVHVTPKVLFKGMVPKGGVKPAKRGGKPGVGMRRMVDSEDDDDADGGSGGDSEEEDEEIKPMKLDFGKVKPKGNVTTTKMAAAGKVGAGKKSEGEDVKNGVGRSKVTHKKKVTTLDQEFRDAGEEF